MVDCVILTAAENLKFVVEVIQLNLVTAILSFHFKNIIIEKFDPLFFTLERTVVMVQAFGLVK